MNCFCWKHKESNTTTRYKPKLTIQKPSKPYDTVTSFEKRTPETPLPQKKRDPPWAHFRSKVDLEGWKDHIFNPWRFSTKNYPGKIRRDFALSLSLSLSLYVCVYIYMCMFSLYVYKYMYICSLKYMCIYKYIYTYTYQTCVYIHDLMRLDTVNNQNAPFFCQESTIPLTNHGLSWDCDVKTFRTGSQPSKERHYNSTRFTFKQRRRPTTGTQSIWFYATFCHLFDERLLKKRAAKNRASQRKLATSKTQLSGSTVCIHKNPINHQ